MMPERIKKIQERMTLSAVDDALKACLGLNAVQQEMMISTISKDMKITKGTLKRRLKELQTQRKKKTSKAGVGEEKFEPEIEKEAEKLLKNPNMLSFVNEVLEYEMTGDEDNRLFCFIINEARKYETQIIRLEGDNTAGKNTEIAWISKFFPGVNEFASSTSSHFKRKVLNGEITTKESILIHTEDRKGSGEFGFDIDQLYGRERILIGFSIKEDGDWAPIDLELEGPLVFYSTSTISPDEHRKARMWAVNPNETLEQSERISRWRKWKEKLSKEERENHERNCKIIKCAISKLKTFEEIKIPYWDFVRFQHISLDDRRREQNFMLFVKLVAHLHQRQRPQKDNILYSLPQDLFVAFEISKRILKLTRGGLTDREKTLLKIIHEKNIGRRNVNGKIKKTENEGPNLESEEWFFQSDLEAKLEGQIKLSANSIYQELQKMVKKGVLTKEKLGRRNIYRIRGENKAGEVFSPFIKISPALFDEKKVAEAFKRTFYEPTPEYKQKIKNLKIPNPFEKKFSYIYRDEFIKRRVEHGASFISPETYSNLLIKVDKTKYPKSEEKKDFEDVFKKFNQKNTKNKPEPEISKDDDSTNTNTSEFCQKHGLPIIEEREDEFRPGTFVGLCEKCLEELGETAKEARGDSENDKTQTERIISLIPKNGISHLELVDKIVQVTGFSEKKAEKKIGELQHEGILYEPRPGQLKVL